MQKKFFSAGSALALGLLMLIVGVCHAQVSTATVTGEIKDATGASISGASVSITNQNTGIVSKTVTNGDGLYRISGLEPGVYRADIGAQGFKSIIKNDITLNVEDVAGLSFTMDVGAVAETVTVEAGAPLVDTQSTSLGETIEGREVQEAPLNGRNPMNLVALVPGVVAEGTSQGSPASNQGSNNSQVQGYGNYQIGGGLAGWNATFVDGANENSGGGPNISIVPTQDSVAEFRVDTNSVSPQFGGFAGGVINFSTKSGGNKFHGSAYEYVRNTILDANTFFNDRLNAPVPILHQNQFGGTVGGPIVKNKTFFFFSWEQTRLLTAAAQEFRVPTPAEMNGDFTADYGTTTDGIQDFGNMVGGAYVPAPPENCPGGGINKICPQHLSPTAEQMYAIHYFTPVATGSQLALLQSQGYNTQLTSIQPNNEIQYVGRVDHQLNDKHKLFLRYTYWNTYIPNPAITKMPAIPTQPTTFTSQQYVAGDTYTVTPTLAADVRLSYNRWFFNQQSNGNGSFNLSQFGPAWTALASQIPYKSPIELSNGNWANEPFSINLTTLTQYNNYALSLSMTKVTGHHSIVFGGEARRIETYDFSDRATTGAFNFPGSTIFPNTGISEFVTGISFNTGTLTTAVNPDSYSYYQGYYVTDTWQARPSLTVNLGLRWELPGAWYEKHDHNSVLLPNAANPLGTFANPVPGGPTNLLGEIVEVNGPTYSSRAQSQVHTHLFEPRLGVNYAIDSKTVIRAGFGITHPCIACGSTTPDASSLNSASTAGPAGYSSMDNPYPNGILQPLKRSTQLMQPYSSFAQTLIGTSISGEEPIQTYTYVEQWNLNLQRSIGPATSLMLAYGGSRGVHLAAASRNLDQLPDQYDSLGAQLITQVANPFFGIAQPGGRVGGTTANYGQFLLPYPEFTGVTSAGKYYGVSSYNAFSAILREHFHTGVTLNASYTWSHFITDEESASSGNDATGTGAPQDYTNPQADYSSSSADIPQTLTLNYILDLPFGKGKHYFANAGGVLDHIVSGWTMSGITTYQSGFPLNFTVGNGNTLTQNFNTGTLRPNVVPGISKKVSGSRFSRINSGQWFNTAAFSVPGPFSFGNESRVDSTLREDSAKNWDMNLAKNTAIKEGVVLQFRVEYFNIFNHPQYGAPVTNISASNFGQITANQANGATNLNEPRIGQLSLRLNF